MDGRRRRTMKTWSDVRRPDGRKWSSMSSDWTLTLMVVTTRWLLELAPPKLRHWSFAGVTDRQDGWCLTWPWVNSKLHVIGHVVKYVFWCSTKFVIGMIMYCDFHFTRKWQHSDICWKSREWFCMLLKWCSIQPRRLIWGLQIESFAVSKRVLQAVPVQNCSVKLWPSPMRWGLKMQWSHDILARTTRYIITTPHKSVSNGWGRWNGSEDANRLIYPDANLSRGVPKSPLPQSPWTTGMLFQFGMSSGIYTLLVSSDSSLSFTRGGKPYKAWKSFVVMHFDQIANSPRLLHKKKWNCQVTGPSAQLLLQIIEGVQILDVNQVNRWIIGRRGRLYT